MRVGESGPISTVIICPESVRREASGISTVIWSELDERLGGTFESETAGPTPLPSTTVSNSSGRSGSRPPIESPNE
jgi:hypothetical protein